MRRAVAVALLLGLASPLGAATYPPQLRFQTLRSGRVSVHFHQGFEPMARQAAPLAADILDRLEARYGQRVGHVQIVLVDADDDPNGFATPVPYPLVTIRPVAPDGSGSQGNHDGWLRLVLTHELTHLVHLEQARGLWGFGRKLLGRAPYLFPNAWSMSWMIEGLATFEETEGTAFGRGRNPDSQMIVRMAALEDRFPSEDQAIYGLDGWPGGQTPYLFGEGFLRRLGERHGEDALPRLARAHAGELPFLDDRTVKKVSGASLASEWRAWETELREEVRAEVGDAAGEPSVAPEALTDRGIVQSGPRFSPSGQWIAYTSRTLERFPEIRLMRADGSEDRRLVLRNGGSGLAWTPDGRRLVYSEAQVHRTFETRYDLSVVEVASGKVRRLTRGLRARDPDVSPDGRRIVFARERGDRSELWTIALEGGEPELLVSAEPGVEWSGPRWSPDGKAIAATRLLPGGWLDVVRVDPATGATRPLTNDRAKDVEPTWAPDGRTIVFRSDREGRSDLYALRADGAIVRLTSVRGGAFEPDVSPDGRSLVFADYTSRGYDLRVMPLRLETGPVAAGFEDPYPDSKPLPEPASEPLRPYRPFGLLLPRFWTPWLELGDTQDRVGVATGGVDALFRHAWGLQALYGTETERVDWNAYYVYDRFRPTFLLAAQEETSPDPSGARFRSRQLNVQLAFPLRRTLRSRQTLSLTWRREREQLLAGGGDERLDLGGLQLGWTLSSARSYPMGISPADGGQLRLAWLREAEALGSDLSLDKLVADGRYYLRLFGERDVLALRVGGGETRGQPRFTRSFGVGGYPDASLFDIVRSNLALLRGYPDNAFTGRRFLTANAEYRFPLGSLQRGWRSLPVFLRHLRGTVFFDAAHAWTGALRASDVKTAVGASLGADTAVAFAVPITLELSVAHGFQAQGDTRVYFRLGLAF